MVKWLTPEIITPDTTINAQSGSCVDIDGNYIIVGAENSDCIATDAGAAFIIERNKDGTFETKALVQSETDESSQFGTAVSISGSYCAVGAARDDCTCTESGRVFLFRRNKDGEWKQFAILERPSEAGGPEAGAFFGTSVSLSGSYLAVGSFSDDYLCTNGGEVYIYKIDKDDNVIFDKLFTSADIPGPVDSDENFGNSVSLSGNYLVVGAPGSDDLCADNGNAYVFEKDGDGNWGKGIRLVQNPSSIGDGHVFGESVSVSGSYCAVGCPASDSPGGSDGSVDIFERNKDGDWNRVKTLYVPDEYDGTSVAFGNSVAISGGYLLVGAPYTDCTESNSGEVFFYSRDKDGEWNYGGALSKPSDAVQSGGLFGEIVAISDNFAVVGAESIDSPNNESGIAVFYQAEK